MLVADEKPLTHQKTRIVSVVAATAIALACGTNYAYSAWAPQFADKLQLSATQSNVVGTAANLGMYASGIPMGIITDRKSPRLAAMIGMFALFAGYYPIKLAYDGGPGYMSMALISFCSFLSGVGSCAAFQAALKTATLNWPTHRGSATACPLAAFGLSAFFYTLIAGIAFPGNTSGLLMMLSLATSLLVLVSIPFLIVVDHKAGTGYAVLPTTERARRDSNVLHKTKPTSSKYRASALPQQEITAEEELDGPSTETSSLLSSGPGDIIDDDDDAASKKSAHSCVDITGLALLYKPEFWQLWVLMGLLSGVGLMTINNIGHDVQALWKHWDDSMSDDAVAHAQLWHVSIISLCSFLGRLSSGIGSDLIVKRLHHSRFWCAAISAAIFALAQVAAIRVQDPNLLWSVSGLSGLAYGVLFGVFPALVVDAFGPDGFAVNWGFMTLAPVVSGNVYNLFYGAVYDSNSVVEPDGQRACELGLACYRTAYFVTLTSSLLGVFACFWGIYAERVRISRALEDRLVHRDA
ncbi:MFS general substrate transporter [Decorospora gaudefroyi]|uniref:MFS general substrate transporter n=1 Tax=Decorospora gaudefroyi TaxID=184978 RepID=A0A6A5KKT1_9PLEO|nr:MFS general substrate transporter [Decorospora gaudefroyi]